MYWKGNEGDIHYMKRLKYDVNEDYFEKIDCPEKAYWLGFLYADGHNTDGPLWRVTLVLQKRDTEHVRRFNTLLYPCGDKKITFRKDGAAIATIYSKKLCLDLAKLNVVNRKSLTITFPETSMVANDLLVYFIQGLFDGDGSVSITTKTKTPCACLDFSGSILLIRKLNKILKYLTGIKFGYKERTYTNTIAVSYIKGNDVVLKFMDWLYADPTLVLPRKYQKYLDIKTIKQNTIDKKSSKYRGVYMKRGYPHAQIQIGKTVFRLGRFRTELDAAVAYNMKAIELFRKHAKLNDL